MMKTYMPIIFEMQQDSVQEVKKNEQLVTIYVLIYFLSPCIDFYYISNYI